MNNYLSVVQYDTGIAGVTDFTVTFPYLRKAHLYVYLNGVLLTRNTDYTVPSSSVVKMTNALIDGDVLTLRRFTVDDTRMAAYHDGSILTEVELNDVTLQLLYLIQELRDIRDIGNDPEGTIPGNPDDGDIQHIVDETLDQLYETAIFQKLTEKIDYTDINAESIIRDALQNHENWELEQHNYIEQGAHITEVETAVETERTARVTQYDGISTRVGDNEAFVGEFRETFSGPDSAVANLTTELGARLKTDDLETQLEISGESGYISGVKLDVSNNAGNIAAEGEKIDTLVSKVNTHVVDDAGNLIPGTNLALVQTNANTAVDDSSANAEFVTSLGAAYNFTGDPWVDPAGYAAAMKEETTAYADANGATATKVERLEVNTQPIFYDWAYPRCFDDGTTQYREGFPDGFPNGAVWIRYYNEQNLTYSFIRGKTDFAGLEGIDPNSPSPHAYKIKGPDGTYTHPGAGLWLAGEITAIGAVIQQSKGTSIAPGSAAANLNSLIQATVDETTVAIEQDIDALVEHDGYVDATYSMKINANTSLGPVMAGFGLGLEVDPENNYSRSDFVVMADYFSIVAPTTDFYGNDDPDGDYAPAEPPLVPFMVDSTGKVFINGDLFVQDTLYSYEGRLRDVQAGRITLGQMTSDPDNRTELWPELVDETAYRLEICSSTGGMWSGPDRNYLMWAGVGDNNGVKHDSNAVFWLDEFGNAYFGGKVQAANISGNLNNAFYHNHLVNTSNGNWLPSTTSWQMIGDEITFTPSTYRDLTPMIVVNFNMVHGRAGMVRIRCGLDNMQGGFNWYSGGNAAWTMDRTDGQQNVTAMFAPPGNTKGQVKVRAEFKDEFGHPHECAGYQMTLMLLPGTTSFSESSGSGGGNTSGGSNDSGLPDNTIQQ